MSKKTLPLFIVITLMMLFSSCTCIYFNTFHNIRKNFNSAEETRKKDGREKARGAETKQYTDAITKSSRVLERHPTSSWIDDALFIIGASYFYLEDFSKADRKFKELLANYPNSEFVPRARLLLAKTKLHLKEEAEAISIFEEIFNKGKDKSIKANAARALGEYYFESGDYEKANLYLQSLIDSLGESTDRLRAFIYVADGYFEKYNFKKARPNYVQALKNDPDSLQNYKINYRMAECDYFLFNIKGGLERLQKLADDDRYYDSLGPIRLKMAEGYEWEGDIESALLTYEQIAVENPRKEIAAIAYYELALTYQYDFEDLAKAREYYVKASSERKPSSVYEDAVRRASRLGLLEEYSQAEDIELETDSTGKVDKAELEQVSRNQYLLGELFYFDLDKPDSAINAYQTLLDRFPDSRYAPKALISMAYIEKHELADTSASDSLLRMVLKNYAHYDEAEQIINLLGLSGTVADTGYAAIVFQKGENFLERFQDLERKWYFPFEVRYEPPVDSVTDVVAGTNKAQSDSTKTAASDSTGESSGSVFVPDTMMTRLPPISDTAAPGNRAIQKDLTLIDSLRALAEQNDSIKSPTGDSLNKKAGQQGMTLIDSLRALAKKDEVAKGKVADTTTGKATAVDPEGAPVPAGNKTVEVVEPKKSAAQLREEMEAKLSQEKQVAFEDTSSQSIRLSDLMSGAGPPTIGTQETDSVAQGMVVDSVPAGISQGLIDSVMMATSALSGDSAATVSIDQAVDSSDTEGLDSDQPVDTVARTDKYYSALALIDSARYYYQYVIDSFPESAYSIQSRYLMIWTYDKYFAPGDSLLIDMYANFVDSFPETPYTEAITKEYNIRPKKQPTKPKQNEPKESEASEPSETDTNQDGVAEADSTQEDISSSPIYKFITDADGNELKKANEYFEGELYTFEYPLEAVADRIENVLYFQIRIDFNGEVDEVVPMNPTTSKELNERIIETVKHTKFDATRIPTELYDSWFYYTREVKVPDQYRQ